MRRRRLPAGAALLLALALAVGVGVVLVVAVGGGGDDDSVDESDVLALSFTSEQGEVTDLSAFAGRPLVVNFFASWCAPCRAELPDFEEVHLEGRGQVQFVGVSHDIDESAWLSFIGQIDLSFPTYYQPGQEIWESLDLIGLPATVFIDREGRVVETFGGPLDSEALRSMIAEHLDVEI